MQSEVIDVMGSEIQVVYNEAGEMFVSVRHVCEAIGIDYSTQRRKIQESQTYEGTVVIMPTVGGDDKQREMLCLFLDMLSLWLAGIHPGKVAEHVRPKLVIYQKECANILYNHFMGRHYLSPIADVPAPQYHEFSPAVMDFVEKMSAFFPKRSEFDELRTEVEELRGMLNVLWNEDEVVEVQRAIKETKERLGWDGRRLIGHIRSELNTQRVYAGDMKDKVLNMCRRMVGMKP